MVTYFQSIAHYLPPEFRNATPIVVVAPEDVGKSTLTAALAVYLQQNQVKQGLGPVICSDPLLEQCKRLTAYQQGTVKTPLVASGQIEFVGFYLGGRPFVVVALAGEDLLAGGIDPARVNRWLGDAIVVLAFHPLLCWVEDKSTPAQFAIRALAYLICRSFNMSAAEVLGISLRLMLELKATTGLNPDYDALTHELNGATFDYEPTGPTPEIRFPLRHPGIDPAKLGQCELAVTEVIEAAVARSLFAQWQLESALARHPRCIRKLVRLDLLEIAPAHGVNAEDVLRQRFGPAMGHMTAGGPDVRSRLQRNRPGLLVVERTHTRGPEQLIMAIKEMVARDTGARQRRRQMAKTSLYAAGTVAVMLALAVAAFRVVPTLAVLGGTALAVGAALVVATLVRAIPRRIRTAGPRAHAAAGAAPTGIRAANGGAASPSGPVAPQFQGPAAPAVPSDPPTAPAANGNGRPLETALR